MAVLRRPLPRFFVGAAFILLVAGIAAANDLDWWLILLVVFAAWAIVTLAERMLWHRSRAQRPAPAPRPEPTPVVERQPEPQRASEPEPEPAPAVLVPAAVEAAPVPPAFVEPMRRRAMIRPRPAALPVLRSQVRWNVWSLEKLAAQHPEHEELEFLVLSLRDFAEADGQLPADFDSLVRESFGELLPG